MNRIKKLLTVFRCFSLAFALTPAFTGATDQPPAQQAAAATQSAEELQQLVAPIALYPDALVAQILAATTYPTEVVEADRWMQEHPNLKGEDLGKEVDKQPWDPSVKALTQFPSVLANLDENLSWTSSLGDAYVNQPDDVMQAVQVLRKRADDAGNLKNNDQMKVETQGQSIVIEPVDPEVVYVPVYDPWLVYGAPVAIWPGWNPYPGLYIAGPGVSFGFGFGIGFYGGFGWGWHHWGFDWGHRAVVFNHTAYISHSTTIVNRNSYHGHTAFGGGGSAAAPHAQFNGHPGAFSGFGHGGVARGYSFRGQSSFGRGFSAGGFHGGGFHGGGGGQR